MCTDTVRMNRSRNSGLLLEKLVLASASTDASLTVAVNVAVAEEPPRPQQVQHLRAVSLPTH